MTTTPALETHSTSDERGWSLLRPRPPAGGLRHWVRLLFGGFYLAMAGVNLTVTLPNGRDVYAGLADISWPGFDAAVRQIVVPVATPLTALVILAETGVSVLVLSRGRGVRVGLLVALAWQLSLAPFLSWYEVANIGLSAVTLWLLARDYDRSLLDAVRRRGA